MCFFLTVRKKDVETLPAPHGIDITAIRCRLPFLGSSFKVLTMIGFGAGLELLIGNAVPRFFAAGQSILLVVAGASLGGVGSVVALAGWRR